MVNKKKSDDININDEDYITIRINNNFLLGLFIVIIAIAALCLLHLILMATYYETGYSNGYSKGYDTLNNEVFAAMEKTPCGGYSTLKNYNKSINLYKEDCFVFSNSLYSNVAGGKP